MTKPLLTERTRDLSTMPSLAVYCAGYEGERWRLTEMVRDFLRRHLTSFALSFSEWRAIDGDSAAAALSRAARMVYDTDKYKRRGEYGELFLHGILRDFYNAEPAVSKIFFADGPNETAKGFDSVHVVIADDGELDLWLGEAKLYVDVRAAVREIAASLRSHVDGGFLRREFLAITNKLDSNWPHFDALADLLSENTSLDAVVHRLVFPILLAYQSPAVSTHRAVDKEYELALIDEARQALQHLVDELGIDFPVALHLITLPLENTEQLRVDGHKQLRTYQAI